MPSINSRILAHRGLWAEEPGFTATQPNSLLSFINASTAGFGIETDIRDRSAELVISHDVPNDFSIQISEIQPLSFLGPVAVNVKSDGLLQIPITRQIGQIFKSESIFFFDMSFPESRQYDKHGLEAASRISDYELVPDQLSKWVWLDSFDSDWYLHDDVLQNLLGTYPKTKFVLVSPELHKREPSEVWEQIAPCFITYENLHICTDYPVTVSQVFTNKGKN